MSTRVRGKVLWHRAEGGALGGDGCIWRIVFSIAALTALSVATVFSITIG
jgi:hypothetical protein